MTTFLAAYAALRLRVFAFTITVLLVLILSLVAGAQTAFGQEVISMAPTYSSPPAVHWLTLAREGFVIAGIVIALAVLIWRASFFDEWVTGEIRSNRLAAAWHEHQLEKNGVVIRPTHPEPLPSAPEDKPFDLDAWAAEADKVAPPPPPKPVTTLRTPSTKTVAHTFSARTRAKGNA